jgi:hypothetical protein
MTEPNAVSNAIGYALHRSGHMILGSERQADLSWDAERAEADKAKLQSRKDLDVSTDHCRLIAIRSLTSLEHLYRT